MLLYKKGEQFGSSSLYICFIQLYVNMQTKQTDLYKKNQVYKCLFYPYLALYSVHFVGTFEKHAMAWEPGSICVNFDSEFQ